MYSNQQSFPDTYFESSNYRFKFAVEWQTPPAAYLTSILSQHSPNFVGSLEQLCLQPLWQLDGTQFRPMRWKQKFLEMFKGLCRGVGQNRGRIRAEEPLICSLLPTWNVDAMFSYTAAIL